MHKKTLQLDETYQSIRNKPHQKVDYSFFRKELLHSRVPRSRSQFYTSTRSELLKRKFSLLPSQRPPLQVRAGQYEFTGIHHIFAETAFPVTVVNFANHEKDLLGFASSDGTLYLCHGFSTPRLVGKLIGHTSCITDFDWSSVNDFIVSTSRDQTTRLWDPQSRTCLRIFRGTPPEYGLSVRFCPLNNNVFAVGTSAGALKLFNVSTGKCVFAHGAKRSTQITALAFDSTGSLLFAGNNLGTVFSYCMAPDLHSFKPLSRLKVGIDLFGITSISYKGWASKTTFNPALIVASRDNTVKYLQVDPKAGTLSFLSHKSVPIACRENPIRAKFCPLLQQDPMNNACIVSGSEDSKVYIYNLSSENSQKPINILQGHTALVFDVSWNCNESLLASSDAAGMVYLWKRAVIKKNNDNSFKEVDS